MRKTKITSRIGFLLLLVMPVVASAETIRCSGHIIDRDMSKDDVLKHCGPPDEKNHQVTRTWTYKGLEGRQHTVVIYFYNNNKVEDIETVIH